MSMHSEKTKEKQLTGSYMSGQGRCIELIKYNWANVFDWALEKTEQIHWLYISFCTVYSTNVYVIQTLLLLV